jgi:hypothetical protein
MSVIRIDDVSADKKAQPERLGFTSENNLFQLADDLESNNQSIQGQ